VVVEADGGSRGNPGPAGYGAVVLDPVTGAVLAERAAGIGRATNNVAEYAGLIAGLTAVLELGGVDDVEVRMDSKLVVEQMSGRWQVKHPDMKPLAQQARALVAQLPRVRFTWIPREKNKYADRLANEAMDAAAKGHVWRAGGDSGVADAADAFLAGASEDGADHPSTAPAPSRLSGWQDADMTPTTTLLLRHGQTAMSVDKRFSGSSNPPLTDLGLVQAAAAARLFGATTAWREAVGASVWPIAHAVYERARAVAREALGEEGYAREWTVGRGMDLAMASETALGRGLDA